MATNRAGRSGILHCCQTGIETDLRNALSLSQSGSELIVRKRNKCLSKGDFLGIVRKWKTTRAVFGKRQKRVCAADDTICQHTKSDDGMHMSDDDEEKTKYILIPRSEDIMKMLGGLSFQSIHPFCAHVIAVTPELDIAITLDRKAVYYSGISEVLKHGKLYGHISTTESATAHNVCINVDCLFENTDWHDLSVSHLRSLLLSEHVAALLEATGCRVNYIKHSVQDHLKKIIIDCGVNIENLEALQDSTSDEQLVTLRNKLHEALCESGYLESISPDEGRLSHSGTKPKLVAEEKTPTLINLQKFLIDNKLMNNYDKIIKIVEFTEGNVRLHKLSVLLHHMMSARQAYDFLIHVLPQERSFCLQAIDIAMKITDTSNTRYVKQVHIVHGPVSQQSCGQPILNARDLLCLRVQEMSEASFMKYGDNIEGKEWQHSIHALAVAEIRFEILSTTCRQPVKLDMSRNDKSEMSVDRRGGVFVMYNCARLSNLFHNFEKAIHQGIYQPLPDISTLDFSLLREEEEWELMFNYVLIYPSLIQECTEALRNEGKKALIHTHKVCHFLQDMSRILSSYYSRFHVLGEPRDHLLPLMYCRLYLLRAIHQVMCNALSLMSITPISQL